MSGTIGVFALTRVGAVVVALEGPRIAGFLASGEREVDCDLARLFGVAAPAGEEPRLVEVRHAGGTLVLAVHDRVRMSDGERLPRHERPAMVAGALRRACLLAVLRWDDELAYLLDVEELAARVGGERGERTP